MNAVSYELRIGAAALPQHGGAADMMREWADRVQSLEEQLETTQRILVEERRWISDARDWYRDHRSSKSGIYDEGTWGDPFAVPGEAEVPASSADLSESSGATATSPVSSPGPYVAPWTHQGVLQALADACDVAIWLSALIGGVVDGDSPEVHKTWHESMRPKLFAALDLIPERGVSSPASRQDR